MFYDERIENTKGKISCTALLISLVISFVLGGIHLANIIRNAPDNRYFRLVSLDIAVFVGTLTVLAIGFSIAHFHAEDERTLLEQHIFFNKAASVLIKCIAVFFAFVLPVACDINVSYVNFADQGFGAILYVLLFIVGLYVIYSFKRNDIYFNYSFMDSPHYYKHVFKNIAKYSFFALVLFCISMVSFAGLIAIETPESAHTIKIFLEITAFYVGTLIEVSLLYLLCSFLEKSSYGKESSISVSTLISLGIAIFLYVVYAVCVIVIDAQPISQADAIWFVSIVSSFDIYIRLALTVFLLYFGYEYQRIRKNKLLFAGSVTVLLSEAISVFLGNILGGMIFVFLEEIMQNNSYVINRILSSTQTAVDDVATVANIVGFVLMIFALAKDGVIHQAHRYAIGAFVILGGTEIFLRTQVDHLAVSIYHFIAEIAVLCYMAVLVLLIVKKQTENQTESTEHPEAVQTH